MFYVQNNIEINKRKFVFFPKTYYKIYVYTTKNRIYIKNNQITVDDD